MLRLNVASLSVALSAPIRLPIGSTKAPIRIASMIREARLSSQAYKRQPGTSLKGPRGFAAFRVSTTTPLTQFTRSTLRRTTPIAAIKPVTASNFIHTCTYRQAPHTKDQLLAQSRGLIQKWKVRFKWMLIRQDRAFTVDEISAFVSWIVMGNLLWFIIGTTTFVSLILYLFDRFLNNQGVRNKYLLKVLKFDTSNLVMKVDSDFSIEFKDGKILLQNLQINDFHIRSLKFNLSFQKWNEGKGLIKDLEINGLSGLTNLRSFDLNQFFGKDYEFEHLVIKDSIFAINGLKLQVFHCKLDKLRTNWFFYDFFNSDNCNGAINDSLFTIHTKQANRNYASFEELEKINPKQTYQNDANIFQDIIHSLIKRPVGLETREASIKHTEEQVNKIIRFRIDELELKDIPKPVQFDWAESGKMELIADIMFPEQITKNYDSQMNEELKSLFQGLFSTHPTQATQSEVNEEYERKYLMIDFKFQFKNLKAKTGQGIDPELVKFINNYNPDTMRYELTSSDLDSLVNDDYFDSHDQQDPFSPTDSSILPPLNFRIIENINSLNSNILLSKIQDELINILGHLKLENDELMKKYKDNSFLIKNLILVGLGVCLI